MYTGSIKHLVDRSASATR